jgi:phosphate transport system protein
MQKHLEREQIHLKQSLVNLSTLIEETVEKATRVFREMDTEGAKALIEADSIIDKMEIKVEEECLKLLALYQPVAKDLRFIVTVLKINNDLERIGDLASNIAKCALFLSQKPKLDTQFHFSEIISKAQVMLRKSIDSLVNMNTKLAFEVCLTDDEVDRLKNQQHDAIIARIKEQPEEIEVMVKFLSVSRYLERIADHATNIAEDVIYCVDGDIIRHNIISK